MFSACGTKAKAVPHKSKYIHSELKLIQFQSALNALWTSKAQKCAVVGMHQVQPMISTNFSQRVNKKLFIVLL